MVSASLQDADFDNRISADQQLQRYLAQCIADNVPTFSGTKPLSQAKYPIFMPTAPIDVRFYISGSAY
ncbi:hypothetical protein CRV24_005134 [Beauveria bassiana]|nr:hypothetical protein CRV24_005134 [Beauveria bassiana]